MISNSIFKLRSLSGLVSCLPIGNPISGITLGIFVSIAAVASATASERIHRITRDEVALFKAVSSKAEQQRKAMTLDPILCLVARQRAADMVRRNYFGHTNPDGQGANTLVRLAGFSLPAYYNASLSGNNIESLGMSTGSPKGVVSLWLKSGAHRSHVLGELDFYRQQTAVGVGIVRSPRPPHYKYYVLLTAPPNTSPTRQSVVLKDPKGKTVASARKRASAATRLTTVASP